MNNSKVLTLSLVFAVFTLGVWGYVFFSNYYPFHTSKISAVVPTNKNEYLPGERVGFVIKTCVNDYKYSDVAYQLESDPKDGHYFMNIGQYKEIAIPGCWNIIDATPQIPSDFCESSIMKPGKHKIYVVISSVQNPSKAPLLYETDWFEISCSENILQR